MVNSFNGIILSLLIELNFTKIKIVPNLLVTKMKNMIKISLVLNIKKIYLINKINVFDSKFELNI
jgi:hypothetical protein